MFWSIEAGGAPGFTVGGTTGAGAGFVARAVIESGADSGGKLEPEMRSAEAEAPGAKVALVLTVHVGDGAALSPL